MKSDEYRCFDTLQIFNVTGKDITLNKNHHMYWYYVLKIRQDM